MEQVDVVVIGAGVVGLAVGRALAQAGRDVLVLEKNPLPGEETSARNSEVLHAGLYYPQGSLKARTCVQGNQSLYRYAQERHLAHQVCGKLVVATSTDQLDQLRALQKQAAANGCVALQWLDRDAVHALEPELNAQAALLSPATGIIDSHGLMQALIADLEAAGGQLVTANPVTGGQLNGRSKRLDLDGFSLQPRSVVNAAGLHAVALARRLHPQASWVPQAYYAKGNYFSLLGKNPFSHLIYPLPEQAGLGTHLTLDLQGRARFGPDVQWVENLDYAVDETQRDRFAQSIQTYWPDLTAERLQPDYAGIRPKIVGPGCEAADFMLADAQVHGCEGVIHLLGIESPGLTACLALAEIVAARLTPLT